MSHHLYEVGIKNCAILTDRFNHCCTIYTEILRDQGLSPEAVYDEVVGVTTHLEILLVAIATEKRSIPSVMILRIARRHQVWAFPAFLEVLSGSLDKLEATTLETLNRSRRTLARLAACFDDIVDEVQGYDISDDFLTTTPLPNMQPHPTSTLSLSRPNTLPRQDPPLQTLPLNIKRHKAKARDVRLDKNGCGQPHRDPNCGGNCLKKKYTLGREDGRDGRPAVLEQVRNVKHTRVDLDQREAILRQIGDNLKKKEEHRERMEAVLDQREGDLGRMESILKDKDTRLEMLQAVLIKKEASLKQREEVLDRKEAALAEDRAQLDAGKVDHNKRKVHLDTREVSFNERTVAADWREVALNKRTADVDGREEALNEQKGDLNRREELLKEQEAALIKDKEALDTRDAELDGREASLNEQKADLSTLQLAIDARELALQASVVAILSHKNKLDTQRDLDAQQQAIEAKETSWPSSCMQA